MLVGGGVASAAAQATGPPPADRAWKLVWSDEFSGPNGSAVDGSKWVSETGGGGWGNNELEYYTKRLDNAYQQDGNLVIKVLQENYTGADGVTRNYTSARLKTRKIRADVRTLRSAHPDSTRPGHLARVLDLGTTTRPVGWPDCGEIDIMENIGSTPSTDYGSMHGPGYSGANGTSPGAPRYRTTRRSPTTSTSTRSNGTREAFAFSRTR